MPDTVPGKQLLHLVFGGELTELGSSEFKDLDKVEYVGVFPNYASAYVAWKAKAQQTVDTPICAISSFTCTACSIPTVSPNLEVRSLELRARSRNARSLRIGDGNRTRSSSADKVTLRF